jgi:hypothetical protein
MLPDVLDGLRTLGNLKEMLPYICLITMTLALRLKKAWAHVVAAGCVYGLVYSVINVDRYKVTGIENIPAPCVSFALVVIAGLASLLNWKPRFVHMVVGICLIVICTMTVLSWHLGSPQFDYYAVSTNPTYMVPVTGLVFLAGCLMVFTKETE